VPVWKDNRLSPAAQMLDEQTGGMIGAYLKRQKTFTGKAGQILTLAALPKQNFARILLLGADDPETQKDRDAETIGAKLHAALHQAGAEDVIIHAEGIAAASLAVGLKLKTYAFSQYRSKKKDDKAPKLSKITIVTASVSLA